MVLPLSTCKLVFIEVVVYVSLLLDQLLTILDNKTLVVLANLLTSYVVDSSAVILCSSLNGADACGFLATHLDASFILILRNV